MQCLPDLVNFLLTETGIHWICPRKTLYGKTSIWQRNEKKFDLVLTVRQCQSLNDGATFAEVMKKLISLRRVREAIVHMKFYFGFSQMMKCITIKFCYFRDCLLSAYISVVCKVRVLTLLGSSALMLWYRTPKVSKPLLYILLISNCLIKWSFYTYGSIIYKKSSDILYFYLRGIFDYLPPDY